MYNNVNSIHIMIIIVVKLLDCKIIANLKMRYRRNNLTIILTYFIVSMDNHRVENHNQEAILIMGR
jgi:hypothetical protein